MDAKKMYYAAVSEKVLKHFERRGIEGHYFDNSKLLLDFLKELIPENSVVSWGGSMTLKETGTMDLLKSGKYKTIDRETADTPEKLNQIFRDALSSDYYFMSSSAITMDGKLLNIDGTGNRVAAICCGPSYVIVVAGMNKIATDEAAAMDRIKNYAAPINVMRLSKNTPCASTGRCEHCVSPGSICSHTVITRRSAVIGRIKVLLVGEDLGF
ncbi:MAG: lactate utilization protein [Spirochaetales bacterium]|nr:lactate utilization protein [Spirochaetales bacterium]